MERNTDHCYARKCSLRKVELQCCGACCHRSVSLQQMFMLDTKGQAKCNTQDQVIQRLRNQYRINTISRGNQLPFSECLAEINEMKQRRLNQLRAQRLRVETGHMHNTNRWVYTELANPAPERRETHQKSQKVKIQTQFVTNRINQKSGISGVKELFPCLPTLRALGDRR